MTDREQFEAAMGPALKAHQGEFALSRAYDASQSYTFLATKLAWAAWSAAQLAAPVAPQEPTSRERSIVLDLVRCGLGHKPLLPAFLHQVHRLAVALPTDEAEKVRRNLQWYEDGRKKIDR